MGVKVGRWLLSGALLLGAAVAQGPGTAPPTGGQLVAGTSTAGGSVVGTSTTEVSTTATSGSATSGASTDGTSTRATSSDGASNSSTEGTSTAADSTNGTPTSASSAEGTSTAGTSTAATSGTSDADLSDFTPPSEQAEAVPPDQGSSVQLTRKGKDGKERQLTVVKTGDDSTGIFAICSPLDDEPEDAPTEFVASDRGPAGVQVTVDKNLIQAPLAIITKQQGGDGHIEMSTGGAGYVPEDLKAKERLTRCGVKTQDRVQPDTVLVTQGKTRLKGAKLVYDEKDGVARIDGPVAFNRSQDDGDAVQGSAERIEVSVDDEQTTLVGKVSLKQGDRTSSADRVDYDDNANTAILHGSPDSPAQTQTPTELLRAQTIRYFLNTGEAVVEDEKGGITGKFDDGEPTDGASGSPVGPTAGTSAAAPASPTASPSPVPPPNVPADSEP